MGALKHKIHRYRTLISDFKNWPQFMLFKSGSGSSFRFKMRNGFEIDVPRQMLPPFKESFFDGVYLEGFPAEATIGDTPVVVDVGANVGYFSLYMLSKFPNARIFGFEPMPFNYAQLKKYQETYPDFDWQNFNQAVADHSDGLTLHSSTLDTFSTMAGVFESDGRGERIDVETLTIDRMMEINTLDSIDLLKLDCEGSEYSILYSMEDEVLKKIKFMSIESHKGSGPKDNHTALVSFLREKGWQLTEQNHEGDYGYIWAWH